jgi:DNA-binding NarL/FixJ family response regulator
MPGLDSPRLCWDDEDEAMKNPLKVMIVEDSPVVRERLTAQVEEVANVEVAGLAGDAPSATRLFQERHPDVVLLDIELPGASGLELLAHFKYQRPSCVVIMLSNYASGPFRLRASELGADFFFSKSDEFEHVTGVVESLVRQRQSF